MRSAGSHTARRLPSSSVQALQAQLMPLEVAARSGALTLLQLQHRLEGLRRQVQVRGRRGQGVRMQLWH